MKKNEKSSWLIVPLMLWIINIFVALVQHVHAGPGHVIPTPLQNLSAMMFMASGFDRQTAEEFAAWVLIGTGFAAILFAVPLMFDSATNRPDPSEQV